MSEASSSAAQLNQRLAQVTAFSDAHFQDDAALLVLAVD